jgi:uncharacterized protein (TIGR01244 family)
MTALHTDIGGSPVNTRYRLLSIVALALLCACSSSPEAEVAETSAPAEAAATSPAPPEAASIDIPNARHPLPGVLTGGQPTREQLDAAAAAGYRTIVNTRTPGEDIAWEEAYVTDLGMRYVFIDTPGADGLTRENVTTLAEVLDDTEAYPMMVHCGSGNRVGALLALKASWIDGASDEEAIQLGLDAGVTRLEEKIRELLAQE